MDQIEDVVSEYVMVKNEQCIVLKMKADKDRDAKIVLTNPVSKTKYFSWLITFYSLLNVIYHQVHVYVIRESCMQESVLLLKI